MTNIMQSEEKRRHSSSNQYTKIPLPIQPLKNVEHVRCVECGNDKRDLLLYNSLSTSWQNSVSTLPISLIGRSRSSSHLGYSGYRGNKQIPGALHRHNREIVLNRSQNKLITKELVSQNHSAPEKGAIKQRPSVFQNSTTGKDYGMVTPLNSPSSPIEKEEPKTPKTPPVTPDRCLSNCFFDEDDDLASIYSGNSLASARTSASMMGSMGCEHPYVARNGTTFSGRKNKFVVHCSQYAGQTGENYLTPTQRAQKQIRRLKELLNQARDDLEKKDSEIMRLTREVVELRLFKASLRGSPDERSLSSDAVTVRENMETSKDVSPIVVDSIDGMDDCLKSIPKYLLNNHSGYCNGEKGRISAGGISEMQNSFTDSGHFEDMTNSSVHSKESQQHGIERTTTDEERQQLIEMYEKRIEELIQKHDVETHGIKRTNNDKVEALLQRLDECNTRYSHLMPDYEQAKEKIRELEQMLDDLQKKLTEQEDIQNKMYLHMYTKGQEAERINHSEQVLAFANQAPERVSVPELLHQLQITQDELENLKESNNQQPSTSRGNSQVLLSAKEAISLWLLGARKTVYKRLVDKQANRNRVDPEITLQFLKSAVYYFLTDKENSQGHLHAIESILGFSELERLNIEKAQSLK